jgi:hypothetical protein
MVLWEQKRMFITSVVWSFYSKTNQMHNISNLFYFRATLYMFRTVSPSIIRSLRLYDETSRSRYQAATESVWHTPDAVCTVLDFWWWTERPSETRRLLFQNKINLRYFASYWSYYRNILRCTVQQTSDRKKIAQGLLFVTIPTLTAI